MKAASSQNSAHCLHCIKTKLVLFFVFINYWLLCFLGVAQTPTPSNPAPFLFHTNPSRNTGGPHRRKTYQDAVLDKKKNLGDTSKAVCTKLPMAFLAYQLHTVNLTSLYTSLLVSSMQHNVSFIYTFICKTDGSKAMQPNEWRHFLLRIQIKQ